MSAAFALENLASIAAVGAEESALVADLKASSEDAFAVLIARYHAPIHSLVSRLLKDPSDAPDITQDVFIKVFRGIRSFHGESTLRTWIYRIAIHEALNQRRWWRRHRGREVAIEADNNTAEANRPLCLKDMLVDGRESPFDQAAREELRRKVDQALRRLPEPFRTVVILRDLEGMTYDEIAEILATHLGTVKSRLVRGRALLRTQLGASLKPATVPTAMRPEALPSEAIPAETLDSTGLATTFKAARPRSGTSGTSGTFDPRPYSSSHMRRDGREKAAV